MKRIFLTAISIGLILNLSSKAQTLIPNFGFEDWETIASYEEPLQWNTSNTPGALAGLENVFPSGNAHSGTKSINITTQTNGTYNLPGAACTGNINVGGSGVSFSGGFPCGNRVANFNGFYKYMSNGLDSATLITILFKRNGSQRDTIAMASKTFGISDTSQWSSFAIPFVYNSLGAPDSALVILLSSDNLASAQLGSNLFVDDVTFSGLVASTNNISMLPVSVSVYPNPATEVLNFSISNINLAKTLNIFDILGKKIKSIEITSAQMAVSSSMFNNSLYFYQIADRNNNVLSTGKFSVKK